MLLRTLPRRGRFLVVLALGYLHSASVLHAQSPGNQQKIDDLVRSAQLSEMLGYILAGVGLLLVILAIPYAIYYDRKKEARKLARKSEKQLREKNSEQRQAGVHHREREV